MDSEKASAIRADWERALARAGVTHAQLLRQGDGRIATGTRRGYGLPSQQELARRHGVSVCTIANLLHGRTHVGRKPHGGGHWEHLTPAGRWEVIADWLRLGGPAQRGLPRGKNRGRSVMAQVAQAHGLSRRTVLRLVRKYEAGTLHPPEGAGTLHPPEGAGTLHPPEGVAQEVAHVA